MAADGSDDIKIGLSPEEVLKAIADMKAEFSSLATHVQEQMGRKAPQAIETLEESAKNGTGKITEHFRNLGIRVREDLKTAFDATGVLAGARFAKEMGEGVRQVLDMERAFDRLGVRLQLSATEMKNFKTEVGRRVANTGANLQDVLPGVEAASARGNLKDPRQLSGIAESLGRVNQTTGEGTTELADTVVEILKNQGEKVTAQSFNKTLDTLQGTRTHGAFTSAEEAGKNIEALSPYARQFHLSTRELGGLSATASQGGQQGNNILQQLLAKASEPGGDRAMNAIFGQRVFKNGKLDASAIGRIDTNRFGAYSQQSLASATGLEGASGADLKRFIEAFRGNMSEYKEVVSGASETATQFDAATDNLASKLDRFRQNIMRSTREVGDHLGDAGNNLLKGRVGAAVGDVGSAAGSAWENKGTLAGAALLTGAVGMLAGSGIRGMIGRVGGGLVKGQVAKAAGAQPVYVVNASEMGGGDSGLNVGDLRGFSTKAMEVLAGGEVASIAAVTATTLAATAAAGAAGYGVGMLLNKGINSALGTSDSELGGKLYDWTHPDELQATPTGNNSLKDAAPATAKQIGDAVADALKLTFGDKKPDYINKSAVQGTGKAM